MQKKSQFVISIQVNSTQLLFQKGIILSYKVLVEYVVKKHQSNNYLAKYQCYLLLLISVQLSLKNESAIFIQFLLRWQIWIKCCLEITHKNNVMKKLC